MWVRRIFYFVRFELGPGIVWVGKRRAYVNVMRWCERALYRLGIGQRGVWHCPMVVCSLKNHTHTHMNVVDPECISMFSSSWWARLCPIETNCSVRDFAFAVNIRLGRLAVAMPIASEPASVRCSVTPFTLFYNACLNGPYGSEAHSKPHIANAHGREMDCALR